MIRSFVLRSGRRSSAQKRSYEELFPLYGLKPNETGLINTKNLFGNEKPLCVEIGFGMGKATIDLALKNPDTNYLGIEVFRSGIGRLLWEIERNSIQNIRIIEGDAAEILKSNLIDNTVSAFHVFFPDPWPKKRHHKRRLIKRPFTDILASKLKTKAYVYITTDWADYGDWILGELSLTTDLVNRYDGFAEHQDWRPQTEFEQKGLLKKHKIWEVVFEKR